MERIWQREGISCHDSTTFLLAEHGHDTAASRGESLAGETPSAFFTMQRAVGNRAVQRIMALRGGVGRSAHTLDAESYEKPHTVQAKCACGGSCSTCQARQSSDRMPALQRKVSGKPLAPTVQEDMDEQFGANFNTVRVHTDARAREAAQQFHANALTMGRDIFFNAGQYDPTSYRGRRILAHELAHVVQQVQGWRPARTTVTVAEPGDRYEREADRIAERVAQGAPQSISADWHGRRPEGGRVVVQERWRGPDTLISRAMPAATPGKGISRMPASGLTAAQIACIKRLYEKALGMPKDGKWKRCYVTAQAATCGLPRLLNVATVQAVLDEAIAPVDWELYLADPRGLACRAQSGQTPEACCEDTRLQPQRHAPSGLPRR